MKATTFVLRQHARMRDLVGRLHQDGHACACAMSEVIEEILSFLVVEEDVFYPAVGPLFAVPTLREETARVRDALLDLMRPSPEDQFVERVGVLASLLGEHATRDRAVVPLAESALDEESLEELGAAMARVCHDAEEDDHGATVH